MGWPLDNRAELADKIDHEGGIWAALEYGIAADDMPAGDEELRERWIELAGAFGEARDAWNRVRELLPEPGATPDEDEA
ncbi:hypothetical protein SAMN04489712_105259 [Thermomonospora echinospora]|uniref:Uncharacterized protein n=1 Tax=Thermomonospora echinospora TaxID=1992 RepID=A0A1H6A955_9ACTN|nr:hypothetical protein [Thermomonospora echinospora]SEG44587.1 hypothetical protein SAMN04489712_105259 [Thermomonospora echinospora]